MTTPLIRNSIDDHLNVVSQLSESSETLYQISEIIGKAVLSGNKIILCGNGGSAADCQHLAAEIVGRFKSERQAYPALALTTDTSILTSIGNDYGFSSIFSRQINALARHGDVLLLFSTSGNSENILEASNAANKLGCTTIGLTGLTGGRLISKVDYCLCISSNNTARIQEAHILVCHLICELLDPMLH